MQELFPSRLLVSHICMMRNLGPGGKKLAGRGIEMEIGKDDRSCLRIHRLFRLADIFLRSGKLYPIGMSLRWRVAAKTFRRADSTAELCKNHFVRSPDSENNLVCVPWGPNLLVRQLNRKRLSHRMLQVSFTCVRVMTSWAERLRDCTRCTCELLLGTTPT